KDKNIDTSIGFFLDTTWRMRPEVATYISEQFYDHDLGLNEICNKREILGVRNGLYFSEIEHEECSRSSKIEAGKVVEIVEDLLTMTFKDSSGDNEIERMVAQSDFMVVAAFNDQVGMLTLELQKKGYSGVRVGTVDKFQGQEAPIVIYSLTSSNKDEIPAGRTEFLFLPNRTNVAVSRAQCLAVVVGSKDLIDTQPTTIPEMEALNNLCRIFQDVEGGEGISSEW
ncbi:MAG: C-terminal helicase domain-containing protein, partial [Acidimicrobiales bacterium]|nr:C-terminal helicase domain-containing protein [Acidimicrobiales bacterium]